MAAIRFSIRRKIMLGCLLLSAGILVFAYVVSMIAAERARNPGQEVEQAFRRYRNYEAGLATALTAIADNIADDSDIRRALSLPDSGSPASAPLASRDAAVSAYVKDAVESLEGEHGLRPDLFVVEDNAGHVWSGGSNDEIHADDVLRSKFMTDIRSNIIDRAYLFPDHGAYVASGMPIFAPGDGGRVVGAVALAIKADRWFGEFRDSSTTGNRLSQQVVLLGPDGTAGASSLPRARDDEVAAALAPEALSSGELNGQRVVRASVLGVGYDVASASQNAYAGSRAGNIATLYVLRPEYQGDRNATSYFVLFALAVAGALIASWVLGAIVTRPIERFIRATKDILAGEGDLSKRLTIHSRDEMGALAENLNRLFDNLQRLAVEVQSASFQVGQSSTEISTASKQMLEGAKDQAVKIEGSTAAVTELSSSIQQVAQNALQATKVAEESNQQVGSAIDRMTQIRTIVEEAAEKIHDLGESGKRIGNIVEVIRQIAEQTSLLALNASIEAAHAGEQGRGFAVVADEVSSLARRVGQSAKDIEDLIGTIKEQTADAVHTMQQGTREVEGGTSLVNTTLGNLKAIIAMVQDTASAVQEQAIASDEIARNMDAVQKIAHEVLTASEEAVIQGEQLRAIANALEDSVRGFRTAAGPDSLVGRGTVPDPALPPSAVAVEGVRRLRDRAARS